MEPGWQQDADDPTVSRYWDGEAWRGELRWNGEAWVDPDAAVAPTPAAVPATEVVTPPPAPAAPMVAPAPAGGPVAPMAVPMSVPADPAPAASGGATKGSVILFCSAAVGALGSLMPWEKAHNAVQTKTQSPSDGGGLVVVLALVGLVAFFGWKARTKPLGKGALIGLGVVAAAMTLLAFAKFGVIGDDKDRFAREWGSGDTGGVLGADYANTFKVTVEAGAGLLLWTGASLATWVGAWFSRKAN